MATNWPQLWSLAATELHIFDPEGDVLFILTRSTLKNDTAEEDDAEFEHLDLMMIDDDDDAIIPEPATNMGVDFDIETELPSHIRVTKANRVFTPITSRICIVQEVHVYPPRVLGPDFKEGENLRAEGSVVIPLPDDDPDCLIVLLNIFHGKTRNVPRRLDPKINSLADTAKLVDCYQLHEAVELFSETLLSNSTRGIRMGLKYLQSLAVRWLWASWVFQGAELFRDMSRLMILKGEEDPEYRDASTLLKLHDVKQEVADGLPLPTTIQDAINLARDSAMLAAIDIIHNFITQYSSELGHCCDATYDNNRELQHRHRSSCDTLVLGSLIKGAQLAKSWLKPEKPYDFNFDSPAIGIRKVEIFSVCSQRDGCPDTVKRSIENSLQAIEDAICGLDIDYFLPQERKRNRE